MLWDCKKSGFGESSLRAWAKRLKHLAKYCDLESPETVKAFVALKNCSVAYKEGLIQAYMHYTRFYKIQWVPPMYRREDRLPLVPSGKQVNDLIASASKKYQAILTLAKYGLRPIEIERMSLRDIDFRRGLVTVRTAKGGRGRTIQLTIKDMLRLEIYLADKDDLDEKPFPNARAISDNYAKIRKRLAAKTGDISILKVRLYDFRHFFGSILYHKTKDILYVKQQLGHKRIENTLIYTHLVKLRDSGYIVKVAKSVGEVSELLEQGFDYVAKVEGVWVLRKPKTLSFSNLGNILNVVVHI